MQIIAGIVERYAPSLTGHGDHEFSILLKNQNTLFSFPAIRKAYAAVHGRSTDANCLLAELTAAGDHVSFQISKNSLELNYFERSEPGTFRNLTVEERLGYPAERKGMKDITPQSEILSGPPVRPLA